jgi:hypothetical protein
MVCSPEKDKKEEEEEKSEMSEQRCHSRQPHFGWTENFFLSSFFLGFFLRGLILFPVTSFIHVLFFWHIHLFSSLSSLIFFLSAC